MLIKQHALPTMLQRQLAALYIVFGQDQFLLNTAAESIKSAWQIAANNESEETVLHIANPADWALLAAEANSYSLFSSHVLIDIRYEKKAVDAPAKEFLTNYLKNINPTCLLLLRAPNLTNKQLQWLVNHDTAQLVQIVPFTETAVQNWIIEQLQKKSLKFEQHIPALIQQYTRGNMYACAQVIEKLELVANDNVLTIGLVQEQLIDQCDYQLFELADACLMQKSDKIILILRHAMNTKVEPTLVLWLLTQEIRLLMQLIELTVNQALPFNSACTQLKIWPQKAKIYQFALKKIQLALLVQLHQFCKIIDERIKSSQNNQIWQALEQVALSLCLARQVGSLHNLLIYGGTFDPPHNGHIKTAISVQNHFNFDRFLFLPCKIPLLKNNATATSAQRIAMLELVLDPLNDRHNFAIDLTEINRDTPSYTVDSLVHFRKQFGSKIPITLLMGADSFSQLPHWHEWKKLLTLANFLVMRRSNYEQTYSKTVRELLQKHETKDHKAILKKSNGLIYCYDAGNFDFSSTWIREQLIKDQDVLHYLPEAVMQYIQENGLYVS